MIISVFNEKIGSYITIMEDDCEMNRLGVSAWHK